MVNTDDFIKRLEIILDYYNLTASSFADKIGVQRSSMSHLLSGRNKPSLDFILKIVEFFQEVDLYWLLNGTGSFPKKNESIENSKPPIQTLNSPTPIDLFSEIQTVTQKEKIQEEVKPKSFFIENENPKEIEKIVIFYKNGTFKAYNPNS
ncbi:helix-turn-helix transcriptional regulator [Flavobacterium sp.]|uniref:helix-turn-helix domain-containing protein n=1 Tax=Flavobacterium sp. TaxID=239 RepID=UPI002B7608ED|nr:helix-turn-helix transcriptional regulator [Flavobacterium sp.]HSD06190.1 helix-turn-helix transcriptional regulator [Flavobacterium sp.]